ncbi:Signal peptidase complex subunit [Fasciolopsis buskii]|uniref:Signal peptidase complex subunit 1 n=1 Tax=Fasciolopsis buskii TaxID=27845 RepID=A0A8E0RJQ7_9TREM|nr:Signal peptidase complex subunit [Fasciolopsis buski]
MDITKIIRDLSERFNLYMDYEGQKKADRLMNVIVIVAGLIAFPLGYYKQQLSLSVYTLLIGCALAAIITIPPWWCYRKHPLKWQKVLPAEEPGRTAHSKSSAG